MKTGMQIIQSGDLFSVDRHRAYCKLKEDMVCDAGGWLREVLANAIDAQTAAGDHTSAILIDLRRGDDDCILQITDAGTGLDERHISALHYMGRTTKQKLAASGKREDIGQFGLGFLSVFAARNCMRKVNIYSRTVDGRCRRICIENKADNQVPVWRELDVASDDPVPSGSGSCFRFEMDASQFSSLQRLLANLCFNTIVPIRFNGTLYANTPEQLLARYKYDVAVEADNTAHGIKVAMAASFGPHDDDCATLYLRRMLAESGSANDMFGIGGDKFAGRSYGRPYLPDEKIVILSQVGESTLARDKVVHNADYELIKTTVNAARAKAVAALLEKASRSKSGKLDSHMEDIFLANLETLYSHLAAYLENRDFPAELRPAVEAVAQFKFFEVYESSERYSLLQLYRMRSSRHGVFLHARTHDVACQFGHTAPVTLRETDYSFRSVFGFWQKYLCRGLLSDIFRTLSQTEPKPSLQSMEEIIRNSALAVQLEEKGVIHRTDYTVKPTDIGDETMKTWFDALRTTLNQTWFRNALSEYDEIRKIRLVPVAVTDSTQMDSDFLAMELRVPDADADEYVIGIRTDSSAAAMLAGAGTGRENLLPAVVQVASCISKHHYGRFVLEQDATMQVAYTQELLLDMYGLEDRVIRRALRVLNSGHEEAEADERSCVVL